MKDSATPTLCEDMTPIEYIVLELCAQTDRPNYNSLTPSEGQGNKYVKYYVKYNVFGT